MQDLLKQTGYSIARGIPQAATGFVDLASLPFTMSGLLEPEDVIGSTDYLTKKGLLPKPEQGLLPETTELVSSLISPAGATKAAILGTTGLLADAALTSGALERLGPPVGSMANPKGLLTDENLLNELALEARKAPSFEEFKKDFLQEIKHGKYYHVTDNPNFSIDKLKGSKDMSSMGGGSFEPNTLMMTSDLDNWTNFYGKDRPFVVELDVSDVPRENYEQVNRGFGNEFFVKNADNVKIKKILPVDEAIKRDNVYRNVLDSQFKSDADLKRFYENASAGLPEDAARLRGADLSPVGAISNPINLFHGTNTQFDEFNTPTAWFTDNKTLLEQTDGYDGIGKPQYIMQKTIEENDLKLLDLSKKSDLDLHENKFTDQLINMGYEGVKYPKDVYFKNENVYQIFKNGLSKLQNPKKQGLLTDVDLENSLDDELAILKKSENEAITKLKKFQSENFETRKKAIVDDWLASGMPLTKSKNTKINKSINDSYKIEIENLKKQIQSKAIVKKEQNKKLKEILKENPEIKNIHKNTLLNFTEIEKDKFQGPLIYKSPNYNQKQSSEYKLINVDGEPAFARKSDHFGQFQTNILEGSEDAKKLFPNIEPDQFGRVGQKGYDWQLKDKGLSKSKSKAGYILLKDLKKLGLLND